jgi:uncharacterized membrane protein
MLQYLTAYGVAASAFLAIDFIWLSRIARSFYFGKVGHLLLDKPNMAAAVAFYAVYVVGVVFFAVSPALRGDSMEIALLNGAFFGFVAYATYDMTNYATLKGWSLSLAAVDMIWGAFLTSFAAVIGYLGARLIG